MICDDRELSGISSYVVLVFVNSGVESSFCLAHIRSVAIRTINFVNLHVAHNLRFHNYYLTRRAIIYSLRFIRLILNTEISDNYKTIKKLTADTYRLSRAIENNLPLHFCNQFFHSQHMSLRKLVYKEKIRFNQKIIWCSYNNSSINRNIYKTNKINYTYISEYSHSQKDCKFVLHDSNDSIIDQSNNTFLVQLDPVKYTNITKKLLEPREKWFVNISNTVIPKEVIGLLQLGESFCLPPDNKNDLLIEYTKHMENSFMRLKQRYSCINKMRSYFVNF